MTAWGKGGLTRLSELGIMVSVIQEPNLEPDARTVMGLLTPVSLPQPADKHMKSVVNPMSNYIVLARTQG